MKGAREYARLFKTGQYGQLYIVSSSHARGDTFRIQALLKGVIAIPNGTGNLCLNGSAVEVYGVVSGNPGWTESYGWLHEGRWKSDFEALLSLKYAEQEAKMAETKKAIADKESAEENKIKELLSKY